MTAPTLFDLARSAGTTAAERCADKAERQGWDAQAAGDFILAALEANGPTSGEALVDACSAVNPPHDGRAFGAVFTRLKRAGLIEVCGTTARLKGHGTAGGLLWRLSEGRQS